MTKLNFTTQLQKDYKFFAYFESSLQNGYKCIVFLERDNENLLKNMNKMQPHDSVLVISEA